MMTLDLHCQVLQHIDGPRPVSLHDAVPESGGRGLVQPAAGLLHQDVSAGPETHVTKVLPNQPHNLKIAGPTSALVQHSNPTISDLPLGQS